MYNHAGLMAEKPAGTSVVKFSDPAALHEAVRAALDACEYEETFNYSENKKSDWPAYQASGYKAIKKFEAEFIRLLVKGVNEKNFFYDVTTPEFGEFGLHLTVSVDAYTGNFGEAISYLVKNYLACRLVVGSSRQPGFSCEPAIALDRCCPQVVATSNSSGLFGERRPSVLPVKRRSARLVADTASCGVRQMEATAIRIASAFTTNGRKPGDMKAGPPQNGAGLLGKGPKQGSGSDRPWRC